MAGNSRPGGIGPLDPIYDVETAYGAVAVGNTPGVTLLTVTINQAAGQPDPTSVSPILFTVVFSEPVTGFATGDVVLTGTATGTLVGAVSGGPTTYTVSVTGMNESGTVIADIPPGVATAISSGTPNISSTSTDNTVNWALITYIWYTVPNGGEDSTPIATTSISVGQRILLGSNYRTGGAGPTTEPPITGTATFGGTTTVAAVAGYDTLGASRGSAGLWMRTCTGAGTVSVSNLRSADAQYVDWAIILDDDYTSVSQSVRSTADGMNAVSLSLGSSPSGSVLLVVQYGGAGGTPDGVSTAAPAGWVPLAHFGRFGNITALHVMIFVGDDQSVAFDMGGVPDGSAVLNGGRDALLLELA